MGEIQSIKQIIKHLKAVDCSFEDLDGYYYAFKISQIGKEFDLLRIDDNIVLNIEIKSFTTTEDKILEQLKENHHYLLSLNREIKHHTYSLQDDTLYFMDANGELQISSFSDLKKTISMQNNLFNDDISSLFKVSDYLISPLNTSMKFYRGEYFLNNHQSEIKEKILEPVQYLFKSKKKW